MASGNRLEETRSRRQPPVRPMPRTACKSRPSPLLQSADIQAIEFQAREDNMIARRTFIKGASALAASASGLSVETGHAQPAPNSSGSTPPKLKAPAGACDCHHHIYDPARFPPSRPEANSVPNARVEDY